MKENKGLEQELKRSFTFQNRELLDNYVILAVTDIEGLIKHVSTSLCNRFKYKPSELINKPYSFLIKKSAILNFENQFNDAKALKTVWKGEVEHSASSDETIWTDTVITPLFNDEKEHVGFILASDDISKEKKLRKINEENLLKQKQDKSVLDFMPSLSSAVLLKTSSGLHKILWIITFTIIFLISWAYMSEIDDIVKSEGKVVTTTNIQTISSLEGGVLKESFVKKGDFVKKDEILFKLSDIEYKKDFEKARNNNYALLAKLERLKAQAEEKEIIKNKEVIEFDPTIMENEINLFNSSRNEFEASINVLKEQLIQRKNELNDATKNLKSTRSNLELTNKEMQIKLPLVEERIISQVELIDLKRKKNDIEAEIKKIKGSIPTLKSSIKEIKKSIEKTTQEYKAKAKDEYVVTYNDLKQTQEDLKFLSEKITDTNIKAPTDGIINKISINTKGEAISPGIVIAQIVPETKHLLAEVKVSPADIGFLYVGQKVRLKLRPYDFSLYGAVDSEISYISADTLKDENKPEEEYYLVQIKADTKFLNDNKNLAIKPGMTVDADILRGKKSILSYILKPIVRSLDI